LVRNYDTPLEVSSHIKDTADNGGNTASFAPTFATTFAPSFGRRSLLGLACGALASAFLMPEQEALAAALKPVKERRITFHHLHTGERLSGVYWANGRYVPDFLTAVNRVLRDHHDGSIHKIDPRLLDILRLLRSRLDTKQPIEVICGYRSPQTNAKLVAATDGVARNSLHMRGMAIDLRISGRRLNQVRRAARSLRAGGVGYYPRSNFVHVDTGDVRYW
jgi:uncharacterized protein YcbK (DUF882 family)